MPHRDSIFRIVGLLLAVCATQSSADEDFSKYRHTIDCFDCYTYQEQAAITKELESKKTKSPEKPYILGMLYLIDAVVQMSPEESGRGLSVGSLRHDSKEIVELFNKAERSYDKTQKIETGYQYIYCKYAELYSFWENKEGLVRVTKTVGGVALSEPVMACRGPLYNIAFEKLNNDRIEIGESMLEEMTTSWPDYPKDILYTLGKIQASRGDFSKANYWWKRCVDEGDSLELTSECNSKLEPQVSPNAL